MTKIPLCVKASPTVLFFSFILQHVRKPTTSASHHRNQKPAKMYYLRSFTENSHTRPIVGKQG